MPYEETAEEREWVRRSADPEAARACAQVAAGINRKDALLITALLADDCTYESQDQYGKLRGRGPVGEHFAVVMENIRRAGPAREARAELAVEPACGGPAVLVHQRDSAYGRPGLGRIVGYLTVHELKEGRVGALFKVTAVPNPLTCRRSGLFPGLAPEEVRAAKEYSGERLPRSEEVTFLLFTFGQPDSPWDVKMRAAVEEVMPEFAPARLRFCTTADKGLQRAYGIGSYPTLVVATGGETVMLIEGFHTARDLREILGDLFEA